MTVKEAAEHTGKSIQTIYNYIHSGKLPAFQNGKSFDINLEDLERVFGNNGDVSDDSKLVQILKKQLEEKDEQIRELHQLLAIAHKNVDSLTEQNQLMLEDMRKPKNTWEKLKKWFGFRMVEQQ
jgi:excisionase family DNA binding protein